MSVGAPSHPSSRSHSGPRAERASWAMASQTARTIAEVKGRHMLIDTYAALFDAVPAAAS